MNCLSGLRLCSLTLLCSVLLSAQQFPSEQQRLIAVAKLWVTIKYFHPYIASKDIDWDKALVDALPAIRNAKTEGQFESAAQSLVAVLHDPLTYVTDKRADVGSIPSGAGPSGPARRVWIHHGLPSALNSSQFYQAFLIKSGSHVETARLALSPSLHASIRLYEDAYIPDSSPRPRPDSDYADMSYPSVELRVLAAFRIWGTIHNFFAYKDLMDEDWDAVFADALPRFIAAGDARTYHLAVAEMISRLSDSNSIVESQELNRYFGEASPGVKIRLIEKRPVITEVTDTTAAAVGLRAGDIVTSVDREKLTDRIKTQANYFSVSTAQALTAAVVKRLLNGPAGSIALLVTSGVDDRPRTLKLPRTIIAQVQLPSTDLDRSVRFVSSNIGYADLTKLPSSEVDAMFQKLHSAAAIIFDARGEIAPLAFEIASCVAIHPDVTTAIVTGPLSLEPDLPRYRLSTTTSSYFEMETVGNTCRNPYKGKTVMLIDERTIGNAEHLGLALESANNTEFLGTPSAGADSTLTQFTAPGGILIRFSGTDVRRANAGPIQRMGLQPALALAPKISAIRAGRDVVLEKAIEYLRPASTQAALR